MVTEIKSPPIVVSNQSSPSVSEDTMNPFRSQSRNSAQTHRTDRSAGRGMAAAAGARRGMAAPASGAGIGLATGAVGAAGASTTRAGTVVAGAGAGGPTLGRPASAAPTTVGVGGMLRSGCLNPANVAARMEMGMATGEAGAAGAGAAVAGAGAGGPTLGRPASTAPTAAGVGEMLKFGRLNPANVAAGGNIGDATKEILFFR